ncbi:MAG TPA: hypothetical protein VHR41_03175 [Gemmatimonadales bacterium]|jgi:hypothetical protein|nr:hypothetical protein [Gemmatimonadales bacterium]
MTLKPAIWYPVAVGLSGINLVAVGFAAGGWHGTTHAALALGFGLWAQHLRRAPAASELPPGLDTIELEVSRLRQELGETQERLDFAERVLAQESEARRVEPQR